MPIRIDELIKAAKLEQALEYARFEIWQHDHRVTNKERSQLARYSLSTPTKMHMSSLMFLAWQKREWILPSDAAKKLHISRQAAVSILKECLDAGWVEFCCNGYRYTDECAAYYIDAIDEMIFSMSSNLTKKASKLLTLRKIASTHLPLTSEDRSSDNDVSEVKYG